MPEELGRVPVMTIRRLLKDQSCQTGQVVAEALGGNEADRVPAGVSQLIESDRVGRSRRKRLIVLGAFPAMPVIGEVLGAWAALKRLNHQFEYFGVFSCHVNVEFRNAPLMRRASSRTQGYFSLAFISATYFFVIRELSIQFTVSLTSNFRSLTSRVSHLRV